MNKATLVVFLLFFAAQLRAADLWSSVADLEKEWAVTYYQTSEIQQKRLFPALIEKATALLEHYPNAPEAKIWLATIMTTNAGIQSSLSALTTLDNAKTLLEEAIQQNPNALEGAAYVTLGTLYYKVPAWPVSFGDNQTAEQLLKTALKINPNGIDSNFFYADFLLQLNRETEAAEFLFKAAHAPVRKEQSLADSQLQSEARSALAASHQKHQHSENSKFMSFFDSTHQVSD